MKLWDIIVIVSYMIGMLAIGRYYAGRVETADEYLLGGRRMNPYMIGLSLFATLTSTVSYLSFPGEMVKHGPMMFAQLTAFPVVFFIVGWWLIPAIMAQRNVTSGYELLESRLGLIGRLLGASMFVLIRTVWMAAILYSLSDKVLVPLLNLNAHWTPWLCVAIGVFTLIYTTEGGMRAVVMTDAVQAFIMFAGAIITVLVVTHALGGFEPWWPKQWAPHWQEPVFWFRSDVRMTFMGAFLNMLVWMTCTAGSDQMAIQRYLSMRNPSVARRAFGFQMGIEVMMGVLLGLVGLAVLGYFMAHPAEFGEGASLITNADELFPRFIIKAMPVGLTGLVIAALLSAAMSSISSGMNSSSAVITSDFIGRFAKEQLSHERQVRLARTVSFIVGIVAILLSTVVNHLAENLLELSIKVVNLLTAPLFVLFFLALFVRRATPAAGIAATIASVTTAVSISFFGVFGLEFLWTAPCSLLVGVVVGYLVSLMSNAPPRPAVRRDPAPEPGTP